MRRYDECISNVLFPFAPVYNSEGVSGECIAEALTLKRCYEIRHLNLAYTGIKVFEIENWMALK